MELRQYITMIRRWMWLIVLAAGIAAVVSYLWNSRLPKVYQASATLMVGQSLATPNPNQSDIFTSQTLALTYIQLAKTDPVLQGIINALKLQMSVDQLGNNLNASIVQGTQLIELRVVDTDPSRAQAIGNEWASQLIFQAPSANDPESASRSKFVQGQVTDVQQKIDDAQKRITTLQQSATVTSSASEIADKQAQIATLQNQINQWQLTYATLLATLAPRATNFLSVVEPARLPTFPIAPNTASSVLLATVIGMALAIAGAFLIEYLDDTLKTPDDVSNFLELPALGTIANIWGSKPEDRLITARHPRASHSEAYRALRTNIQIANSDQPTKALLITSANPKEGKSITSANLAVVMALSGLRVILVDCDLRRPQQHKIFHLSNNFGLVSALLHPEAVLNGFIQPTETENLKVMTSGPVPPNPSELLASKRMQDLTARLEAQSDIVIFDSAPCLPRTDAVVLARHVDGILLVVDTVYTRRTSAMRAKEAIAHSGKPILGVVLNRIPHNDTYYYYYYYSDEDRKSKRFTLARLPMGRAFLQLVRRFGVSRS